MRQFRAGMCLNKDGGAGVFERTANDGDDDDDCSGSHSKQRSDMSGDYGCSDPY